MSPITEKELKSIAHHIGNQIWVAELSTDTAEPGEGWHQTRQLLKMIEAVVQRKRNNHHGFKRDC
jgi:hypothetical protein